MQSTLELRVATAVQNANCSHAIWQAFWGEEAPTESNDSMDLAVTEGFIKAASQAVKEELLQEWQSFRADLLRDLMHLIRAEVAKVSLGSPAQTEDVPGTPLRRSKSQEVETPEKLAARVNGENMDTVNPVLVMEEVTCAPTSCGPMLWE
mmetsp:Transcript_44992/g.105159  ORF Transcript_44992/g.105159 Transcript_44992/m.105159 type:complete len:150 (-) Transcript_44992:830-1279(-)